MWFDFNVGLIATRAAYMRPRGRVKTPLCCSRAFDDDGRVQCGRETHSIRYRKEKKNQLRTATVIGGIFRVRIYYYYRYIIPASF